MGKRQNHKEKPRGQPFPSRRPQGCNEQKRTHDKHRAQITQMIHKRSTALERSVKILLINNNSHHFFATPEFRKITSSF